MNSVTAGLIEKWTDIEQYWTVLLQASLRNRLILAVLNSVTAGFIEKWTDIEQYWTVLLQAASNALKFVADIWF